jgi:hypothetical protein
MRILSARIHVLLDVAFALAFAVGPLVYGLGGSPAAISFVIAVGFVVLAASAWFVRRTELGPIAVVHGLIELAITLVLAFLPRIDGYSPGSPARSFFWTMAVAVGVVWLLSAYGESRHAELRRAPGQPVSGP